MEDNNTLNFAAFVQTFSALHLLPDYLAFTFTHHQSLYNYGNLTSSTLDQKETGKKTSRYGYREDHLSSPNQGWHIEYDNCLVRCV